MNAIDTTNYSSVLNNAQNTLQSERLSGMAANQNSTDKLDDVSKQFASVMMTQLLQTMFEGVPVDPNFGGGHGEETWRSVLLDEYGKKIGNNGGLGLASMVKQQLLKYQEVK